MKKRIKTTLFQNFRKNDAKIRAYAMDIILIGNIDGLVLFKIEHLALNFIKAFAFGIKTNRLNRFGTTKAEN